MLGFSPYIRDVDPVGASVGLPALNTSEAGILPVERRCKPVRPQSSSAVVARVRVAWVNWVWHLDPREEFFEQRLQQDGILLGIPEHCVPLLLPVGFGGVGAIYLDPHMCHVVVDLVIVQ